MIVYIMLILYLGKKLSQQRKITYLTAAGSAICGASAIAIVAPAIDADSDDISISLLSVAMASFVGLYIIIPFLATSFDMDGELYALLSGSVLQFTGAVRASIADIDYLNSALTKDQLTSLAMSVKAFRYIGLLVVIPLFASYVRKRFHMPGALWIFFISGIIGTLISIVNEQFYSSLLIPFVNPIYEISWSIAMAAVGLNVDMKGLLSNNGSKALIMAFAGFFLAIATFLGLTQFIQLF